MTNLPQKPLVVAALGYARRGWPVLPLHTATPHGCTCSHPACSKPGKHPRTEHGLKEASRDSEQLRAWWRRWPAANIGIRTGRASGLLVLDLDRQHGGIDSLEALRQQYGTLPSTLTACTGGGGRHFLFRYPEHVQLGNKVGWRPGLDIRAEGGYIVASPSTHASGERYAWLREDLEPEPCPAWLVDLLCAGEVTLQMVQPRSERAGQTNQPEAKWLQDALARAGAGTRNETGFWLALQLRDDGLPEGEAEAVLLTYAQAVAELGDHPYTVQEALASLRSAYREPPRPRAEHASVASISAERQNGSAAQAAVPDATPPTWPAWSQTLSDAFQTAEEPPLPPPPPRAGEGVSASPEPAHQTDLGNAARFARQHQANVRYCYAWKQWLLWDGKRWKRDTTGAVLRLARETVRHIYQEAAEAPDGAERKALARWAMQSEAERRINAMLHLAESEPGIPIEAEALDRDPWLLNVENGTLDLRTGMLRPHRREDLLTRLAPVVYDPQAACPRWLAFLARILDGNMPLLRFLQQAIGYSLTGDTREQVLFLLHGSGANGKSTFLEVIQALLAEYALQTPAETLVQKQGEGIPNDVARLKGARFVAASETEEGKRLAEGMVKKMTGGDVLTARFLHQEYFEFRPEFKLFLATNHKPLIRGTDHAIWRRIRLIPFQVQIPDAEKDRALPEKLKAELAGILTWALEGCLSWQQEGLSTPTEVLQATEAYRDEMDVLKDFLEGCCIEKAEAEAKVSDLYAAYVAWCEANGERALSQKAFGLKLMERGLGQRRTNSARFWVGIGIVEGTAR